MNDGADNNNPVLPPKYCFMDVGSLKILLSCTTCSNCKGASMTLDEKVVNFGFAQNFTAHCDACNHTFKFSNSNAIEKQTHLYDINRRGVQAFTEMGIGQMKIERFCAFMNMNPIGK